MNMATILKRRSSPSQTFPDIEGAQFPTGVVTVSASASDSLERLGVDVLRILKPHAQFKSAAVEERQRESRVGLRTGGRIVSSQPVTDRTGQAHAFTVVTDLAAGTTDVYADGVWDALERSHPLESLEPVVIQLQAREAMLRAQFDDLRAALPDADLSTATVTLSNAQAEYDALMLDAAAGRASTAQRDKAETACEKARERHDVVQRRHDALQARLETVGAEIDATVAERHNEEETARYRRLARERSIDDLIFKYEASQRPLMTAFDALVQQLRHTRGCVAKLEAVGATPDAQCFVPFAECLMAFARGDDPDMPRNMKLWL
jgi:hypothetical protein